MLSDTAPGFQPFGFAGGLYDPDTKLVRVGARDFDGPVGRWTAKDPVVFNGNDLNLYGYAWNNPVSSVDPVGLWGVGVTGSGSAEIGAVTIGAAGTGAVGAGVFYGQGAGVSAGAFASGGVRVGGGGMGYGYGYQYPHDSDQFAEIGGAFAGAGAGAFITNSCDVTELKGPFDTYSFNIGVGPLKWGFQFGKSGRTWIFSVTPFGASAGISGSGYPTTTATTSKVVPAWK